MRLTPISKERGFHGAMNLMSGISGKIFLDPKHIPKHLPNTPQSQRLLLRGRATHVFNDEDTMLRVAQAIIERCNIFSASLVVSPSTICYSLRYV